MKNGSGISYYLTNTKYIYPISSYLVLILLIACLQYFFSWGLVLSLSATYMLVIPFLIGSDDDLFAISSEGIVRGIGISTAILVLYILAYKVYAVISGWELGIREFSYTFLLVQFLMVALPEELFFRGYLQNELGNNFKGIVIVSVFFAAAHLITICVVGGSGFFTCAQNGLTFFPSLVMGYLYMRTGTIWSSIFFHFFANVVHILLIIR